MSPVAAVQLSIALSSKNGCELACCCHLDLQSNRQELSGCEDQDLVQIGYKTYSLLIVMLAQSISKVKGAVATLPFTSKISRSVSNNMPSQKIEKMKSTATTFVWARELWVTMSGLVASKLSRQNTGSQVSFATETKVP